MAVAMHQQQPSWPQWPHVDDPWHRPLELQHSDMQALHPIEAERLSARWSTVATSCEDASDLYDCAAEHASLSSHRDDLRERAQRYADVARVARANAAILDDLATDLTLGQARMDAIWREFCQEPMNRRSSNDVAAQYAARGAREAWLPTQDGCYAAAAGLREISTVDCASGGVRRNPVT